MARNTRTRPRDDDDDEVSNDRRNEIRRDLLNMDPEDIDEYVAELDSAGELQVVNEWLSANGMTPMSADLFDQSDDDVASSGPVVASPQEAEELGLAEPTSAPSSEGVLLDIDEALAENEAGPEWQNNFDDAVSVAAADYADTIANTGPGLTPDQSGIEVPAGYTPEQREKFLNEVLLRGEAEWEEQRGRELAGAGVEDEDAQQIIADERRNRQLLGDTNTPTWLLQLTGTGDLTDQQKDRYVEYWNDAYGTFYRDFDRDLAPILSRFDGTEAEAQNFTAAVLADQEPTISRSITVPLVNGVRRISYTEEELDDLRAMGFSNDAITRLVRVAGMSPNAPDRIRQGAAGDTLDIGPLAALTRYYGGGSEFAGYQQRQQNIAEIEQQLGLRPGGWARLTAKERQAFREQKDEEWRQTLPTGVPTSSFGEGPGGLVDDLEELTRAQGRREDHTLPGILAANNNFQRGMETYRGDQFLSLIHAVDPALAQRVAAQDDPDEPLDWRDNEAVYNILEQAGVIEGSSVRLRQLEDARGFFGYFASGGGRGGGAAEVRRMVDPESVRQQVQELWSRLFLADVDDATVQAITANLQSQLDAAPDGMSFDVSSRIMAFLQGQDVYDELYRNKPAGLTEEQFQGQFAAGIADVIGNELDPEALKAGMRTGDYNTAVGRAASTEKLLTSSTLRGRWAQAKQTLDRFS